MIFLKEWFYKVFYIRSKSERKPARYTERSVLRRFYSERRSFDATLHETDV